MKISLPCIPYDLVVGRPCNGDQAPAGASIAKRMAAAWPVKFKHRNPGAGTGAGALQRTLVERASAGSERGRGLRLDAVRAHSRPASACGPETERPAATTVRRPMSASGYHLPALTPQAAIHPGNLEAAAENPAGPPQQQAWRNDPKLSRNTDLHQYAQTSEALVGHILPESDREILTGYTDKDFATYNPAIRAGLMEATEYTAAIDQLIAGGLDVRSRVFRGLTDHSLITEGGLYEDKAPGSASVIMDQAVRFARQDNQSPGIVLHLFGAQAANVSGLSTAQGEFEALVRPGEVFRVLLKLWDHKSGVHHAVLARVGSNVAPIEGQAVTNSRPRQVAPAGAADTDAASNHEGLYIEDD